jgi:transcriptional regulator with XRE-family HTH domain
MQNRRQDRPTAALGRRIRELRHELNITQEDLAHLSGVNVSNLGKIERGLSNPRLDSLQRVAYSLGTSVSDLTRYLTDDDLQDHQRQYTARDFVEEREARRYRNRTPGEPH